MEQLRLDLFPQPERDRVAEWRVWLVKTNHVDEKFMPVYDRLLDMFPFWEACERSKAMRSLSDDVTPDDLGLFTAEDYHTCWDRSWALRNGLPVEQVREIQAWDYTKGQPC